MKAQAQGIIHRVRVALDELADTVDTLPGDEEEVDVDAAGGSDATDGGTDPKG